MAPHVDEPPVAHLWSSNTMTKGMAHTNGATEEHHHSLEIQQPWKVEQHKIYDYQHQQSMPVVEGVLPDAADDTPTQESEDATAKSDGHQDRFDTPMFEDSGVIVEEQNNENKNGNHDAMKETQTAHHILQEAFDATPAQVDPHQHHGLDISNLTTSVPGQSDEVIMEPYRYLSSLPGKGVRNLMIDSLNVWAKVPEDMTTVIKTAVNILHSSSLMLDDLEDSSPLRRGKPSTHMIYGPATTINSATFLFISVIDELAKLGHPEAVKIYTEEMRNLFIGQSYDIHWIRDMACPTITQYLQMIDGKTGGLFRLAARLLLIATTTTTTTNTTPESSNDAPTPNNASKPIDQHTFDHLCCLLGRYFQIRDDYQNLMSADYTAQKGYCEDLDEGKYSIPLIHTLTHTPHPLLLRGIFHQRRSANAMSREQKQVVLEEMHRVGSLEFTREVLGVVFAEVEREIGRLEDEVFAGERNGGLRRLVGMLRV